MTATDLLGRLRSLSISLVVDGGKLRVSGARSELSEDLKQQIVARKAELIALLDAESQVTALPANASAPLSLFQERLWMAHQLEPNSTAYNLAMVWTAPPGVSPEAIARGLQDLCARHDILRSTFAEEGGTPRLQLLAPETIALQSRDLQTLDPLQADQTIAVEREAATHTPFNLAVEPPVRWTVYHLAGGRVAVLISAHHIALDQWSFALLRREFGADCLNAAAGAPPRARPTLQYADCAAWQRRNQDPAMVATDLAWWERRLSGLPQLSTFRPDLEASEAEAGASRPFCWSEALTTSMRRLAHEHGATLYMALVATCAVVLRAHTGQSDLVLGSPMGMRERVEFESVIGPFVNLLLLRLDLDDDPSFAELLKRAREVVLEAHEHRRLPFETLVERLNPVRSFNRSPLYQVAVVLHDASHGLEEAIWSGGAIQDLTWFASEVDGRLQGSFEYRSDLYRPQTIDRIIAHISAAAAAAARDPRAKISRISLLDPAEREQVVRGFNQTEVALPFQPVAAQFEAQVRAHPEAIALTFEGRSLSYGELNACANRIARRLGEAGVARGAVVGVLLPRGPTLIATLLAVHKVGGAYVPLDPTFPAERVAFMIRDSGMRLLVVSDRAKADEAAGDGRVQVLDLNMADLDAVEGSNLGIAPAREDLAYILYTSGSTGQPNGVMVSHGAFANFIGSMQARPGLRSQDVLAAVTTVSFDIAGLELFLPLIVGARIELIDSDTAADGHALAAALAGSGATMMQATPAAWRLLVEVDWRGPEGFSALCGGEALSHDLAAALLERVGSLWNLYGPTETTVWSTVEKVERGDARISVGRPIANTQVYVVDQADEPTPIGVAGEICIGGAGVAEGYHARPELTARRFVRDRFSPHPGARLYRTGDLGFWDYDGRLFHAGRIDHQVKIRGFRVELGEIEAALTAHPGVARVVVVAREVGSDDQRLVAYVVFAPGRELTASELRAHLRKSLPDYMAPSLFVPIETVPLTPNGKIDRRALPNPYHRATQAKTRIAPTTGMEQLIADIWRELLQVDQVGVDDNFFELGGHSLLSLRAAALIAKETGWRMPPRTLFVHTLRQIASMARREIEQVRAPTS